MFGLEQLGVSRGRWTGRWRRSGRRSMSGSRPVQASMLTRHRCVPCWCRRRRRRLRYWPNASAARALHPCCGTRSVDSGPSICRRIRWTGWFHEPGQAMQCDLWFPHEPLPLGHGQEGKPPVLVMTSAFSGYIQARMLPTRTTFDLLGGMWSLLQEAGAVPKQLVWDKESGIGQGRLTEPAAAFAGVLGCEIRQLPPRIRNPRAWWSG